MGAQKMQLRFSSDSGDAKVVANAGGFFGHYDVSSTYGPCNVDLATEETACTGETAKAGNSSLVITSTFGDTEFSVPVSVSVPAGFRRRLRMLRDEDEDTVTIAGESGDESEVFMRRLFAVL